MLVVWGLVTQRPWRVDRRTGLVFGLAFATPVGEAFFSIVGSTKVFGTRNLAASWPALALAGAALLVAAGPRVRDRRGRSCDRMLRHRSGQAP